MIPTFLEAFVPAAQIAAIMGGIEVAAIEEAGIICEGIPDEDQSVMRSAANVMVMGNAGMARKQFDALLVQGFTREEALPIVAAILGKKS